ncbi:MAG: EF-P lysine aminoacylase GenX [Dehalococcoidia bacterium]|nr:MAG: EF-P lysine aminoacylase GenX [Dehalococcoidia bacterium]
MPAEQERLAQIKSNLKRRAQIYDLAREFFRGRGFLEVETPVRVPVVAPEINIVPFESEGWYLAASPELHMKRLLASVYENIFQISHCFRKGERGRLHNPEFSLLEWYRAGANCMDMISDTEQLVTMLARKLRTGSIVNYQGQPIDLRLPWPRLSIKNAFIQSAGWDPVENYDAARFDQDMAATVLPGLEKGRPTVLTEYPAAAASLARLKAGDPQVAERAEVFIGGLELANAYSELTDLKEQWRRFTEEIKQIERQQGRKMKMPDSFIEAVGFMPECGGIALGMDRLAMLLCDAGSIDEVIAFTADNI